MGRIIWTQLTLLFDCVRNTKSVTLFLLKKSCLKKRLNTFLRQNILRGPFFACTFAETNV